MEVHQPQARVLQGGASGPVWEGKLDVCSRLPWTLGKSGHMFYQVYPRLSPPPVSISLGEMPKFSRSLQDLTVKSQVQEHTHMHTHTHTDTHTHPSPLMETPSLSPASFTPAKRAKLLLISACTSESLSSRLSSFLTRFPFLHSSDPLRTHCSVYLSVSDCLPWLECKHRENEGLF